MTTQVRQLIDQYKMERSQRVHMDAGRVYQRVSKINKMDVDDIRDDDGRVLPIKQWPMVWWQTISGIDVTDMIEWFGDVQQVIDFLKKDPAVR